VDIDEDGQIEEEEIPGSPEAGYRYFTDILNSRADDEVRLVRTERERWR
jgi:hypothetical protein